MQRAPCEPQASMWHRSAAAGGRMLRRLRRAGWAAQPAAPAGPPSLPGALGAPPGPVAGLFAPALLRQLWKGRVQQQRGVQAAAATQGGARAAAALPETAATAPHTAPRSGSTAYLAALSEEQVAAVTAELGATRVVAGPGSGKTRVLTSRIAYLLGQHGVPAWQVLAITFTNKAAGEMRERLEKLLGPETAQGLRAGTFHSFCHLLLRRELHMMPSVPWDRDFSLYDEDMAESVIRRVVAADQPNLPGKEVAIEAASLRRTISGAKNTVGVYLRKRGEEVMLAHFRGLFGTQELSSYQLALAAKAGEMFDRYQEELARNNALDFDDLLSLSVALLREVPEVLHKYRNRYRHVLLDEFQDTNAAQYLLVKLLSGAPEDGAAEQSRSRRSACSVFVVGDPDQAIYGFRGSDAGNMRSMFERDFPHSQRFDLRDNYRSAACILGVAQRLIDHNKDWDRRKLRAMVQATNDIKVEVVEDDHEEARFIGEEIKGLLASGAHVEEQIAVLYRTNMQSRLLEQEMVRLGIKYVLVGGVPFWRRVEVQDVLAYLRLAVTLQDDVALERVINVPKRQLGPTSVAHIKAYAKKQGLTLSQLLLGREARQVVATCGTLVLPELPDRKELGITPKAAAQVEAFREAVAAIREGLLQLPLKAAMVQLLKLVKYREYVADGGCSSNKDDKVGDRLERLGQLLVAAEDYEPGCLAGLSPSDDEEEQQQAGAPGTAAAAGAAPGSRARASSVQQGPAGSTRSGSASSSSGGANGGRGSRAHNLFVARTFLDEVALFSSSESGVGAKGVRLMTVHASKGLEFEAVFVAGCNEGRLPLLHKDSPDSDATVREERRLFFVGLTRAKQRLVLVHALEQTIWGDASRKPYEASRFLAEAFGREVLEDLLKRQRHRSGAAERGGPAGRGWTRWQPGHEAQNPRQGRWAPQQQQQRPGSGGGSSRASGGAERRAPPAPEPQRAQSAAQRMQAKRSGRR